MVFNFQEQRDRAQADRRGVGEAGVYYGAEIIIAGVVKPELSLGSFTLIIVLASPPHIQIETSIFSIIFSFTLHTTATNMVITV